MLGSGHYVDGLDARQRGELAAYLNFDMLGSPNFVRYVYDGDGSSVGDPGPPGSAALERLLGDYLNSRNLPYEPTELSGRSDYAPFARIGVPVGGLFSGAEERKTRNEAVRYGGTEGEPLDRCYHRACDTLANVADTALDELGDAAGPCAGARPAGPAGRAVGRSPRASSRSPAGEPPGWRRSPPRVAGGPAR